jgi:hypothetical protein
LIFFQKKCKIILANKFTFFLKEPKSLKPKNTKIKEHKIMYEPKEKIDLERAKKLEAEAKKIRKKAKEIEKYNQLIEDANFGIACKNILTEKDLENLETLLNKFNKFYKRKCEVKDLIKLGETYLTKMENAQTPQD